MAENELWTVVSGKSLLSVIKERMLRRTWKLWKRHKKRKTEIFLLDQEQKSPKYQQFLTKFSAIFSSRKGVTTPSNTFQSKMSPQNPSCRWLIYQNNEQLVLLITILLLCDDQHYFALSIYVSITLLSPWQILLIPQHKTTVYLIRIPKKKRNDLKKWQVLTNLKLFFSVN